MMNSLVVRYCWNCGKHPVAIHNGHVGRICERCLLSAIVELINDPEIFKCPGCETPQDINLEPPFVCPKCGWNEYEWD